MTSYEIGLECDKTELELQEAIKSQSIVEQEILLLRRQVIDLQGRIKDLEYAKCKATENRQVIASRLRILKSNFFAAKNQGI